MGTFCSGEAGYRCNSSFTHRCTDSGFGSWRARRALINCVAGHYSVTLRGQFCRAQTIALFGPQTVRTQDGRRGRFSETKQIKLKAAGRWAELGLGRSLWACETLAGLHSAREAGFEPETGIIFLRAFCVNPSVRPCGLWDGPLSLRTGRTARPSSSLPMS